MIRWLRRYRNFLWITVTVAMLLSVVGAGGYYFTSKDYSDTIAVVGSVKIPYLFYRQIVDNALDRMRKDHKDVTEDVTKEIKQEVVQTLIANEIFAMEAEKLGLHVSDEELSWVIHQDPRFQYNGAFNQNLYLRTVLQGFNTSVEDYEAQLRRELVANKYKGLVSSMAKLVPGEIQDEYKRSHNGSVKNFNKDKDTFSQNLHQIRGFSALQTAVRKAGSNMYIHTFLNEREQGGA